jgi:Na+/melibiose symporter-like transporter
MSADAKTVAAYGAGSIATGIFSTVPSTLLLFYATNLLGLPPYEAALAIVAPKLWAILWDPMVGRWSDRHRSPWGRRRPFMLAGLLGMLASFLALFGVPSGIGGGATLAWIAIAYFILATTYSLFAVPYTALVPEMAEDDADRERITAWRIFFALAGVLAGAGTAPALISAAGGGREGYLLMALVLGSASALAMAITVIGTARIDRPRAESVDANPLPPSLRLIARDAAFVRLVIAYVVAFTAVGAFSALVPYVVVHVLAQDQSWTGTLLGTMILTSVAGLPVWSRILSRIGAWRSFAFACLIDVTALAGLPLATNSGVNGTIVVFVAMGFAFAGLQLAPFSLAAHLASRAADQGLLGEGAYTGVWTAAEKVGLALGPGIAGAGLSAIGFAASMARGSSAAWRLSLLSAAMPAVLFLLAIVVLAGRLAGHQRD